MIVWQVQHPWEEEASRGRYYRGQYVHDLHGAYTFEFAVCDEGGNVLTLNPLPVIQFVLDGVDVGAPQAAIVSRKTVDLAAYAFASDTLQHCLWGRIVGGQAPGSIWMLGVLFTTGPPPPLSQPGWCWTCTTKYDLAYGVFGNDKPVRIWYPGHQINPPAARFVPPRSLRPEDQVFPPEDRLLIPRELRPIAATWTTMLPHTSLHMTRLGSLVSRGLCRRFGVIESTKWPGVLRAVVTAREQYAYFDGVQQLATARGWKDAVPLVDGPRGSGQLGHGWSGWVARHSNPAKSGGCFITCTNGRYVYAHRFDGRLTTVAGRRLRTEDDFTGSTPGVPATSKVVGLQPSAQTYGPIREAQMENVADWQDEIHDFSEPWGAVPLGPYPTSFGDIHHERHAISDTLNHRFAEIDHRSCHEAPGRKPTVKTFTRFRFGTEPWDPTRVYGTDEIWVPEFMGHALTHVSAATGAIVERIESAGPKLTLADIGTTRGQFPSPIPRTTLVSLYIKDGPVGTAKFIFPQVTRHDSHGNIEFVCRYTHTRHRYTRSTGIISLVNLLQCPQDGVDARDIGFDLNWDGTCGPLDCARITQWGQETDAIYSATGVKIGTIFARGDAFKHVVIEGPADWLVTCQYPTLVASGLGRVYVAGTGTNQGLWMQTRRLATDSMLDVARYRNGIGAWKWGGGGPSFALSNGEDGQGHLGLPTWDDLALLPDAVLAAALRAGAGTGIPRTIGDVGMKDLIYVIRWNAVTSPPTGGGGDTTSPSAPTLKLISAVWG